jgi:hypothetical protein
VINYCNRRNFSLAILATGLASSILTGCESSPASVEPSENEKSNRKIGAMITRNLNCSLTRNGSKGVFGRLDTENLTIALVDFETHSSKTYRLDSGVYRLEDVVVSPDGGRIAYTVFHQESSDESEIWIMDPDGLVEFKLTGSGRSLVKPHFSPDGTKLLFFADMRHQYLTPEQERILQMYSKSFAVHELNLSDLSFHLIDLPILPVPKGCFYTDQGTVVALWMTDVEDPEFSRLPAECVCGSFKAGDFGGNFWERNRWRLEQTVGEADIRSDGTSKFKKFEMTMPEFGSIRDTFWINASPCKNGFLTLPSIWDPSKDPSTNDPSARSYRAVDHSTRGLAWITRNGNRRDIELPPEGELLVTASGSFDQSRIIGWPSLSVSDAFAQSKTRFPWTHTSAAGWQRVDLNSKYAPEQTMNVKPKEAMTLLELPKLIDKNGVGETYETKYLKMMGAR